MRCRSCETRKARRSCPALGGDICPTCCGTKRLVEIACPDDCGWLLAAAAHPPAARQRQHEADQHRLRDLLAGLSEPEYVVLTTCLQHTVQFRKTAVPAPLDSDLREAAAALRATFETEARGVVYEHRPDSLVAARLSGALRDGLDRLAADGFRQLPVHAAAALRRIERQAGRPMAEVAGPTAFLEFLERILRASPETAHTGERLAADALAALQATAADGVLGPTDASPSDTASGDSRIIMP